MPPGFYRPSFVPSVGNTAGGTVDAQSAAAAFDPSTGRFLFTSDGAVQAMHPVDQRVAFLVCIKKGSLKASAAVGFDEAQSRGLSDDEREARMRQLVEAALQPAITNGDIELNGVSLLVGANNVPLLSVDYTNLRAANATPKTVTF